MHAAELPGIELLTGNYVERQCGNDEHDAEDELELRSTPIEGHGA
jgi:hypothetical protein